MVASHFCHHAAIRRLPEHGFALTVDGKPPLSGSEGPSHLRLLLTPGNLPPTPPATPLRVGSECDYQMDTHCFLA